MGVYQGTIAYGINTAGDVAGIYIDATNVNHGFVRAAIGTMPPFDAPGAGTAAGQGTRAFSIKAAGHVSGYYVDASKVNHGFVRTP